MRVRKTKTQTTVDTWGRERERDADRVPLRVSRARVWPVLRARGRAEHASQRDAALLAHEELLQAEGLSSRQTDSDSRSKLLQLR